MDVCQFSYSFGVGSFLNDKLMLDVSCIHGAKVRKIQELNGKLEEIMNMIGALFSFAWASFLSGNPEPAKCLQPRFPEIYE
jgi:hypothetical protein